MVALPDTKTEHPIVWQSDDGLSAFYNTDAFALMQDIPNDSIDCVWTDPPYLLSNDGVTCIAGKRVSVNKGDWDRSNGIDDDHDFNLAWLSECYRILKPAGTIWVTGTLHIYLSVGMAMMQLGFRILNDVKWEKTNPPPNLGCRCFTHSTETLLWAMKAPKDSKRRHTFNYDDMKAENDGKRMGTVWRYPATGSNEKRFGKHPTQKARSLDYSLPTRQHKPRRHRIRPIRRSASTGVAALSLGRKFIGNELEQEYADGAAHHPVSRRILLNTPGAPVSCP